jgi:hypothetical protein
LWGIHFGCLQILSVISSLDERKTPYKPILLKLFVGLYSANNVYCYGGKHHIHTVLFVLMNACFEGSLELQCSIFVNLSYLSYKCDGTDKFWLNQTNVHKIYHTFSLNAIFYLLHRYQYTWQIHTSFII